MDWTGIHAPEAFAMSPFALSGPQFLAFYAAFALLVLAAFGGWLRSSGVPRSGRDAKSTLDALTGEPYRIACLRDGPDEAVRVAVVNLIDRGLLVQAKGRRLRATLQARAEAPRHPLDAAILARCIATPLTPQEILAERTVRRAAAEIESDLTNRGLVLAPAQRRARSRARLLVVTVLAAVAAARVLQALAAGRSNVGFLVGIALLACVVAWALPRGRLSAAGRRALASLRTLMGRLKPPAQRLSAGGATDGAMLLAAVFGIYALPAGTFAFVEDTFPRPRPSSDSGGDGGSSSSSGSSDGGDGGGGGGGCGGCGGCGGGD